MTKENMIRKQIYLEPKQNEQIKYLSAGKGLSEAEIIREAIGVYLIDKKGQLTDPIQKLIGMVATDKNDGSLKHDTYLYTEKKGKHE